jgi:pimeloyl-ACP methyl ester carboxylesterase
VLNRSSHRSERRHNQDAQEREADGVLDRADAIVSHQSAAQRQRDVVFEESSHMPHHEERDRYMQVVGDWLARHD